MKLFIEIVDRYFKGEVFLKRISGMVLGYTLLAGQENRYMFCVVILLLLAGFSATLDARKKPARGAKPGWKRS